MMANFQMVGGIIIALQNPAEDGMTTSLFLVLLALPPFPSYPFCTIVILSAHPPYFSSLTIYASLF